MKSEEKDYLFHEKIKDKSREMAYNEIKELEHSQKQFKMLNKELKRKDKLILKLENQIAKLQKTNFKNLKLIPEDKNLKKVKEIKASTNGRATIKEINRVMCLIESEKEVKLTDLAKVCIIQPKVLKGILKFLIKYNLIEEVNGSRGLRFRKK